jgi:hypothetical protein
VGSRGKKVGSGGVKERKREDPREGYLPLGVTPSKEANGLVDLNFHLVKFAGRPLLYRDGAS